MWMSPQSFTGPWMDEFYDLIRNPPTWLSGVVYGPQVRVVAAETARRCAEGRSRFATTPTSRTLDSGQYPVPDWDVAFALTEGREVCNPRPAANGSHVPLRPREHGRVHHLLRGLPRRRQQDGLERAGGGTRRPT